jgi:IS30 family transposase
MRTYKQLIQEQRYQIEILLKAGSFQHVIAGLLGVSKSSISRELSRNKGTDDYDPKLAQHKADTPRKLAIKAIKMTPSLITEIETRIKLERSPEQVSGQLKDEQGIMISHERINQHVWTNKLRGGLLYKHLRQCHKKRKRNMARNILAKNAIRPFLIGRKAWLFSDNPKGAKASAIHYSLIETAKANSLEPYSYLNQILKALPYADTVEKIEALLPWHFKKMASAE